MESVSLGAHQDEKRRQMPEMETVQLDERFESCADKKIYGTAEIVFVFLLTKVHFLPIIV